MKNSAFLKDFKEFAMKGNVVDMAVGVIIGGAFGKIVTSLVSDVIMPVIGMLTGGIDFTGLKLTVGSAANSIAAVISIAQKRFFIFPAPFQPSDIYESPALREIHGYPPRRFPARPRIR